MKDNIIWWLARAALETLVAGGLLILSIWIFESFYIFIIFIPYSKFIFSFHTIFYLIIIVLISLFLTNILFISLHKYKIITASKTHFVLGSLVAAFFETFVSIGTFWFLYFISQLIGLIILSFLNPEFLLIIVFLVIFISNFLFDILFRRIETKSQSININ